MTSPDHISPVARRRTTRLLCRVAAAVAVAAAVVTAVGTPTHAGNLHRNELADEITGAAGAAVEAYDDLIVSGSLNDYMVYAHRRAETARLAARELGYDEGQFVKAWRKTTLEHQRAVLAAMTQVGVPYRTNTSVEGEGFDCSGLTLYAWQESGTELFRQSGSQINAAERLSIDEAKAGDLVHYPGHVMMYLGVDDAVVHSVNTGRTVEIDTISKRKISRVTFGDPTV